MTSKENKKYVLLKDDTKKTWDGKTLYRVKALVAIGLLVSPGTLGGYIESEKNLSVSGNAWVSGNAEVYGNARVYGNAEVSGNARVYGNAEVSGNARVYGNAEVSGDAWVYGNAWVSGDARVYGNAWVSGDARVSKRTDIQWFTGVGSDQGTLTVFRQKDGSVFLIRGCFGGTLEEFKAAVQKTHGNNRYGQHYNMLIQSVEFWFNSGEEVSK
ncbi:polymer-forming cytoskeletal protein [Oxalobacter vibrioformis]|uniref:Polymer-forming cytoskeletal protein n=1 Tax=Oxalobacter vibrioformis TaxID=933080 RepID=A0A9E9LYP9_9BURK|nr:polymer-forming cytoskeletal protein [Oxalobacter vibrioformis]WAW09982.1 polymer-forming cytoskeletal protein [Oxalobacter vibrioformis]